MAETTVSPAVSAGIRALYWLHVLYLGLVPARWQLPEAYLGGKRPEGLTGYLAQVSLGGLVVGGLLVDLYYVFKPDIEGLVGIDLLFFATVIAVDAAFLCHSMWRGHVKDENVAEVGVTLLLGFSFWCLAMMSAPTG